MSAIKRGDLRVAINPHPDDQWTSRLVLVARVDDAAPDTATVLLCHSAPELATSADLVIPRGESDVPYPLVVQCDLVGVLWSYQLKGLVGRLDRDVLNLLKIGAPEGNSQLYTGIPLAGPYDPRWNFKAVEGGAFQALTGNCTATLLAAI